MKTADGIEYDIARIVMPLLDIRGRTYLSDRRNTSDSEDCVVRCITLFNDTCFQEGVVNINVYVPHIDNGSRVLEKDSRRVIEIGEMLLSVNNELLKMSPKMELKRKGYYFTEYEGVQSAVINDKNETIVNNKLSFKYYGI